MTMAALSPPATLRRSARGLTKEDRPFVNEVLNNPRCDVRIRFRALAAVREMGLESADAAPLYVRALSPDQGPDVCGTAARLLGTVDANGKSAAFKALVAYGLSNSNTKVVDAVVDSLNKLGTPDASAADDLATILGNDKLTLRAQGSRANDRQYWAGVSRDGVPLLDEGAT